MLCCRTYSNVIIICTSGLCIKGIGMSDSFGKQTEKWMEGRNCLKKSDPYLLNLLIDDLDLVSCLDTSRKKYDDHDTTMQGIVNKAERIVLMLIVQTPCLAIHPRGKELVLKKKGQELSWS